VRVRHRISLPKLRKTRSTTSSHVKKDKPVQATVRPASPRRINDAALDEHFYVKWKPKRKLVYDDFRNNRNVYNKLIPDRDTDLINTIYPDYLAFYASLKKRKENDPLQIIDMGQDERIERMLKMKADSIEAGYVTTATLDVDLSATITIDSPAASSVILTPVIYALNETTYYYNITAVLNKYESWMIVKSADILAHEQIHFDIFELFARKMRKHLIETLKKSYNDGVIPDISADITSVYDELYRQLNKMQLDFDRQTGELTAANAPLVAKNATWNKSVKDQLEALKEYELAEGTIVIK
jgi:hypothetical protein